MRDAAAVPAADPATTVRDAAAYREQFFAELDTELERAVGVRAVHPHRDEAAREAVGRPPGTPPAAP